MIYVKRNTLFWAIFQIFLKIITTVTIFGNGWLQLCLLNILFILESLQ